MFTDYYAEQSCTAGTVDFHHRAMHVAHRPFKGWHSGCHGWPAGARRNVWRNCSSHWVMPQDSLARSTSAIVMIPSDCTWVR
jgi:hypothetical protein